MFFIIEWKSYNSTTRRKYFLSIKKILLILAHRSCFSRYSRVTKINVDFLINFYKVLVQFSFENFVKFDLNPNNRRFDKSPLSGTNWDVKSLVAYSKLTIKTEEQAFDKPKDLNHSDWWRLHQLLSFWPIKATVSWWSEDNYRQVENNFRTFKHHKSKFFWMS